MENTSIREALEAARDLLLPQCNGGTAFAKACGETVNKIMDALKEERTSDGNAAAMREALLIVKRLFDGRIMFQPAIRKAHKAVDAALSAPARNCDKMPDIDNLTMHDLAKSPCKSTLEYASREELLALVRWLLAPAAERKGECDGR